jgi:hypothetical protein
LATGGCAPTSDPAPSDTGSDTDAPAATFTEIHTALFPQETPAKCDACHGQPASQVSNGLLDMGRDDHDAAYAALIDHSSTSRDCAGMPYVVPGDPEGSLFYVKLLGDPECGERMPLGGGALPAGQIDMVRSWIMGGALDD